MVEALYGGSLDPFHLGHLSVVEIAAESFDAVRVVVLANPEKLIGLFSRAHRAELVAESTRHLPNVSVHEHHGLIVDAARQLGANVLLRSAHKERGHEHSMAATNETLTGIRTFFVLPDLQMAWISSSMVRELAAAGLYNDLSAMVPAPVHDALRRASAAD